MRSRSPRSATLVARPLGSRSSTSIVVSRVPTAVRGSRLSAARTASLVAVNVHARCAGAGTSSATPAGRARRAAPDAVGVGGRAAAVGVVHRVRRAPAVAQDLAGRAPHRGAGRRAEARRLYARRIVELAVCGVADVEAVGAMTAAMRDHVRPRNDGLHLVNAGDDVGDVVDRGDLGEH